MAPLSGCPRRARGRLLLSVALGLTLVAAVAGVVRLASYRRNQVRVKRLENVQLPLYPQATDVRRTVDHRLPILMVQYTAPVSYPSKAVFDFYAAKLPAVGWSEFIETGPAPGGWQHWTEEGFATHEKQVEREVLLGNWQHLRSRLLLRLQVAALPGHKTQEVLVNVFALPSGRNASAVGASGSGEPRPSDLLRGGRL